MRSLRGRLALGVMVVLVAALAVSGTYTSHYVDHDQRAALDDRLRRTAELSRETAVNAVAQGLPDNDRRLDAVLTASGTSLRLLLGSATLLQTGGNDVPAPPGRARSGLRTFTSGGRHYRTYVTTLRNRELGGLAKLEITSSLSSLEDRQRALERRLVLVGLVVLVVAGLGVFGAAELILRPLRRLRAVTSSIADDEDLDRRVPADDGPAELRSLAASFNAMLARLGRSAAERERALQATRRFAADAGHELRTPLTSVQAVLDIVRSHPELTDERRSEMLGDAQAEQHRLVALIDGLQALARGDAQSTAHAPVDLGEIVAVAVDDAQRRHPLTTLRTEAPDAPVIVAGWELGLRVLADNLVENAARHGRDGGEVTVRLTPGGDGHGPVLSVGDDGPGIPADERERIFEPFARAPGTRAPGSGLGLALVAQQVGHHDAAIEVGVSDAGGACFAVRFPVVATVRP